MKAPLLSLPVADAPGSGRPAAPPGPKHLPGALTTRWGRALEGWDAPAPAHAALERLADPRTRVVVTGQQPGVWGGPLYCLYKAATAVALAERLERDGTGPAAAVFWMNADDTDWDEVGWGALPRPDLDLYRTRWTVSPVGSRRWVGGARIRIPDGAEEVFAAWGASGSLLGAPQGGAAVELGETFARCLLAYLGERGLVPLDARWPEVRAAGSALWSGYLPRHRPLAEAVIARGRELAAEGAPAPLDAAAADHGLFLLDGDRRGEIDPRRWEADVAAALASGGDANLAPSVLLRAPLQDHLFGTAAQVVGAGEAAYLRQLTPIYHAFGIPEPERVPRLAATLIPAGLLPLERTAEIVRDPEAWLAGLARDRVPAGAAAAVAALRGAVSQHLEQLVGASEGFRKDMEQSAEAARRKIDGQIHRLEEVLDRRARQDLYRERPALRNLPEFLRPHRGDQDRGLSGATLALFYRDEAPGIALRTARAHLDRLEEGSVHHFVLEGPGV